MGLVDKHVICVSIFAIRQHRDPVLVCIQVFNCCSEMSGRLLQERVNAVDCFLLPTGALGSH